MIMAKQPRNNSVINRQSDAEYSEDHWLKQFENSLQKTSVQPRGQESLVEQINSIMNTKSKYPSVQAAVDDMMNRSGLSSYLDNVKVSEHVEPIQPKKTAQQVDENEAKRKAKADKTPDVIKRKKDIAMTLDNIIKDSKGNLAI